MHASTQFADNNTVSGLCMCTLMHTSAIAAFGKIPTFKG